MGKVRFNPLEPAAPGRREYTALVIGGSRSPVASREPEIRAGNDKLDISPCNPRPRDWPRSSLEARRQRLGRLSLSPIPMFMMHRQRGRKAQMRNEAEWPRRDGQVVTNSRFDKPETDSFHNRTGSVRNLEGVEEMLEIVLHGSQATAQSCTDFFVAEAVGQQVEQFALHRAD